MVDMSIIELTSVSFVCHACRMIHVWSCLSIDASQRRHQGNQGYEDVTSMRYVWNSTVPNHKLLSSGDLLVLRDRQWVLGCGWVDEIATRSTSGQRHRCPVCRETRFEWRKTMLPRYRCRDGHEFNHRDTETINVIEYVADYGRTWRSVNVPMPVKILKDAYLGGSKQHSIRPLSVDHIQELLGREANLGGQWWDPDGGIRPGGHTLVLHKARVGQNQFRNQLLQRLGSQCAVTGPQPEEVLEAAHLYRYADTPHHDIRGGLLLRRDVHALFDRGLLTVSTTTWTVELAPRIRAHNAYAGFHGRPLQIPTPLRPATDYLDQHRSQSIDAWAL